MLYKILILYLFFSIKNTDAMLGMKGCEEYDFKTDDIDSYFINYIDGEENIKSLDSVNQSFKNN